jgi:hypothetical protein
MNGNPYESPQSPGRHNLSQPNIGAKYPLRAAAIPILNFLAWEVGVFLNSFGGFVDQLGAFVCIFAYMFGILLVPILVLYAGIQKLVLRSRRFDFVSPLIAVGAIGIMEWQLRNSTLR